MRIFLDGNGREWTAWEVHPARGEWSGDERRLAGDRRVAQRVYAEGRVRGAERRGHVSRAVRTLGTSLAAGWLAFQAGTARRRLAPIPAGWDALSDRELVGLCERAAPASPAITPIVELRAPP